METHGNQEEHWPTIVIPHILSFSKEKKQEIKELAVLHWNKQQNDVEETWESYVHITLTNGNTISGTYKIKEAAEYQYSCSFSVTTDKGLKLELGVPHNEVLGACKELCREDLMVRLAKLIQGNQHYDIEKELAQFKKKTKKTTDLNEHIHFL